MYRFVLKNKTAVPAEYHIYGGGLNFFADGESKEQFAALHADNLGDYTIEPLESPPDELLTELENKKFENFQELKSLVASWENGSLEQNRKAEEARKFMLAKSLGLKTSVPFEKQTELSAIIAETLPVEVLSDGAEWESGVKIAVNTVVSYNEQSYKCVQSHVTQSDWTPDTVPALFAPVTLDKNGVPVWTQPLGAADAYNQGDRVSHSGSTYISAVGANVWEPGVYGWELEG